MTLSLRKILKSLGPGIITAALVFGPGSLTVTTKLGAGFGFRQLWVIVLAVIFMTNFTRAATRIGIYAKRSLLELIRERFGKAAGIFLGLCIFVITASFQAGNSIGSGVAFAELTHTSTLPWVIFFTLSAISLLFFRSFYRILERIMIGMVLIMLISFLITLILCRPSLSELLSGLIPSLPKGSEVLSVALFASSFSVAAAFYQAYLVREKGWRGEKDLLPATAESRNGVLILGLLSAMVLICAAAVLHREGIAVNTASDLGRALEPLFGKFATYAFMCGFFAASFSSLIGNATIGGALLADAFGQGTQLSSRTVRLFIVVVILVGAGVALYFGALPLQLIIFAQAFTIIVAPIVGAFMLLIARDPDLKASRTNNLPSRVISLTGLGVLILLAGYQIIQILR